MCEPQSFQYFLLVSEFKEEEEENFVGEGADSRK